MEQWQLKEIIVRQIEAALAGSDAIVEQDKRFYDENGVPTAEVDICITQHVGSFSLLIIGEVRDRQDRQGTEWIDKIKGKKDRLGAHHAFAVSTSGFSSGVRKAATQHNIGLRELSAIDEASSWFMPVTLTFSYSHPEWDFATPPSFSMLCSKPDQCMSREDQCINYNGETVSINDLLTAKVDEYMAKDPMPQLPSTLDVTLDHLSANLNGNLALINYRANLVIRLAQYRQPLIFSRYTDPEAPHAIAVNGVCTVNQGTRPFILSLNGFLEDNKLVRLQGALYTLDGQPYDGTGMTIQIYGYKAISVA